MYFEIFYHIGEICISAGLHAAIHVIFDSDWFRSVLCHVWHSTNSRGSMAHYSVLFSGVVLPQVWLFATLYLPYDE